MEVYIVKEELLKGLTEEQIAKFRACKGAEEILALAKKEGITLNDEQLEAVSGGTTCSSTQTTCPNCGSSDVIGFGINPTVQCRKCGTMWDPLNYHKLIKV